MRKPDKHRRLVNPQRYSFSKESMGMFKHSMGAYVKHTDIATLIEYATRYQWLREQPNDTEAPRIDVVLWEKSDDSADEGIGLRMEELDAKIDEFMKKCLPR